MCWTLTNPCERELPPFHLPSVLEEMKLWELFSLSIAVYKETPVSRKIQSLSCNGIVWVSIATAPLPVASGKIVIPERFRSLSATTKATVGLAGLESVMRLYEMISDGFQMKVYVQT